MTYAGKTTVAPEKTRVEIERLLAKHGAERFGFINGPGEATIGFEIGNRHYAFRLPLPLADDYKKNESGRERSAGAVLVALEQAKRSRWRGLLLIIRAKLEAVQSGVVTMEDEFLAHIVIDPDGTTVADYVRPRLPALYAKGDIALLPPPRT